jgi:putative ribosome biogenesis GTPase RsgA
LRECFLDSRATVNREQELHENWKTSQANSRFSILSHLDSFGRGLTNELYFFVQADKVVQMYETMLTRHTTMIVGPTGGGKSVVINTLAQAQTR